MGDRMAVRTAAFTRTERIHSVLLLSRVAHGLWAGRRRSPLAFGAAASPAASLLLPSASVSLPSLLRPS